MNGKQLKNSILQWAIQGKLVPQDPNDEPASVLLERIRAEKARLVKEGKIKKDKNESIIFRGDDNSHYEKFLATGVVKCIDDEIPFEIPEGWEWCRLRSLVYNHGQITPSTSFSYIDIGSIDNTNLCLNSQETVLSAQEAPSRARKIVKWGDILYSTVRPYLHNMCIIDRHFSKTPIASTGFAVMTCYQGVLNKYLFLFLQSPQFDQYANDGENAKGVAYPAINDQKLYNALIALPPEGEQKRISSTFEDLLPSLTKYGIAQQKLNVLNCQISEKIKKSILQEAIQGRLVPQDSNDEPASVLLEQIRIEKQRLLKEGKLKKKDITDSVIFKGDDNKYYEKIGKETICIDEEIPFEIPYNWVWVRLASIVQINPKNQAPDNVTAGFIPMELIEASYISSFKYFERKWKEIKNGFTHFSDGDVAFAKITPCFQNRKAMILKGLPNGIGAGTTELKVLHPYSNTLDREYLLFFLESPYFVEEATFKGTANQQRIISGYLENKLFPLPPLVEQKRIATKVKQSFELIGLQ